MPFNGSGTFNRVHDWTDDRDAAIPITASRMDSEDDGFATGLSNCVTKDGQTTITANLPMAGFKHTGVGNSNARTDYPATGQIQDNSFRFAVGGGSADAQTLTLAPAITAYTDGMVLHFEAGATNTGAATFNVNSVGAQSIVMQNGDALPAGAITSGRFYTVIYDLTNTNWVLVNPSVLTTQSIISPDTTANAVSIAGDSVTTANVVDISADGLTSGKGLSVTSTSDDTGARSLVHIDQIGTLATGTICLEVTQASNNEAVTITSDCTTADGVVMTFDSITGGRGFTVISNSSSSTSRQLSYIQNTNASATQTTCLQVRQQAANRAVFFQNIANGTVLQIDASGTTATTVDINSNSTTTGTVFDITANGLTTGEAVSMASNSSSSGTRNICHIHNQNTNATGSTCLRLENEANVVVLRVNQDNASFTSVVSYIDTVKAANSDFKFVDMRSNNAADTEFAFRGDGEAFADGSFTGGGADYAEFYEWLDGNPNNEDRRGLCVVLDGKHIREATLSDPKKRIIGVISGNPTVVGDSAWNKWSGKYITDDFGSYVMEDYEVWSWVEYKEDGEFVKSHSYAFDNVPDDVLVPKEKEITYHQRRKINPDFDPDIEYIPREKRKEWAFVGRMGKLRIRKGQVTRSDWIKMRDVSDSVEEWTL